MNIKNIKRYSKVSKSILIKKLISKLTNKIINNLQGIRDRNASTYSIDYLSYFSLSKSKFDLFKQLDISLKEDEYSDFKKSILNHDFRLLSDEGKNLNRKESYDILQSKFHKGLIPTSTKCYNFISDDYKQIDWQSDFNNSYTWSYALSKNISYGKNNGADIKVPWELGRLQHLPSLAYIYKSSGEDEILNEIKNQLFDFIASNPPNYGVQWLTAMDVGIRLVNILITLHIIEFGNSFDNNQIKIIESYLFDHFIFIKNNDEFSDGMRGNHYLSNICSIIIYLAFIDENESKEALLNKYINIINREIKHQFNEDGTNFEASTRYHIFTSQMLFTVDLVLKSVLNIEDSLVNLDKILSFTNMLLKNDFPPQFGDNDSGFYWKILNNEQLTYGYFKNNINVVHKYKSLIYRNLGYVYTTFNDFELHFKCGKLGQNGKGGHDHNDNLSYCLYFNKVPIVVDPGTFCYTSDFAERNKFRSTSYHNVVTVEDKEQNEFQENVIDDMFWLDTDVHNPKIELIENKIKGSIYYCGKRLVRTISHISNEILVSDKYNNDINKVLRLHLHPEVAIEAVEKNVYKLLIDKYVVQLTIDNADSRLESFDFSPEYGVKLLSKRIVIETNENEIIHSYKEI